MNRLRIISFVAIFYRKICQWRWFVRSGFVSQDGADASICFRTRRKQRSARRDLEDVIEAVARLGRALGVAMRLDGARQLGALGGADGRLVAREADDHDAGTVAQVGLEADDDDRRPRTEVAHLWEPLERHVGEAVAVVDREADDDDVRVGIGQRSKLLVVLLPGRVPQRKLNRLTFNLTRLIQQQLVVS